MLGCAGLVLPILESCTGAVAADFPRVGLLQEFVVVQDRQRVEPRADADHVIAEVLPRCDRLYELTGLDDGLRPSVVGAPAVLARFLVHNTRRVALGHPLDQRLRPRRAVQGHALRRLASEEAIHDFLWGLRHGYLL